MLIERRFEAVHEAHRAQSRLGCGTRSPLPQHLLDHAQEDRQYRRDRTQIVPTEVAEALGYGRHPLPHGLKGNT